MSQDNPSQGLVSREVGPMSITPQERTVAHESLDRLVDSGIGGSTHDPNVAAAFIEYAQRKHILLSPVMGAFRMRPGWELAFTKLRVDTSKAAKLVYKVNDDEGGGGGREWTDATLLAFHKPLLYIIRTHLGIDIKDIERIDKGAKDYCYEFKVFAEYLGVDGQIKTLVDVGGLDLSDGSEGAKKILNEARGDNAEVKRRNGESALTRKRAKVMQFASTNAEERVIQSYGFRGSYTKAELDTKFLVCVKPIFTGYHPDPAIQQMLVTHMLQQKETASGMLYGSGAGPAASAGFPAAIGIGSPGPFSQQEERAEAGEEQGCTPDKCLGIGSPLHVPQCIGAPAAKTPEPWIIPEGRGPAAGLAVNDERVAPQILASMREFYVIEIENPDTPDLARQGLKKEQAELEAEIERRGLFEFANK